jgi:hypothetical protein
MVAAISTSDPTHTTSTGWAAQQLPPPDHHPTPRVSPPRRCQTGPEPAGGVDHTAHKEPLVVDSILRGRVVVHLNAVCRSDPLRQAAPAASALVATDRKATSPGRADQ